MITDLAPAAISSSHTSFRPIKRARTLCSLSRRPPMVNEPSSAVNTPVLRRFSMSCAETNTPPKPLPFSLVTLPLMFFASANIAEAPIANANMIFKKGFVFISIINGVIRCRQKCLGF